VWVLLIAVLSHPAGAAGIVAEAEALMAKGQAGRAAALLYERLDGPGADPALLEDARAWGLLGESSRAAGDFETAAFAFERGWAKGGDAAMALLAAEAQIEMKNPEAAERVLARLTVVSSEEAPGWRDELNAAILILKNREEEARPFLERAEKAGRAGAAHYLGLAAFHRGDFERAVRHLDDAVRSRPTDYYSLLYRAWAFLELNRVGDARGALDAVRAVAATPEAAEMTGRLELRAERFEEALARFREALAANPGYAEAQFGVATALRRLGRREEAKAAAEAFRKLHRAQMENLRAAYDLHQRHLARPADPQPAEDLARHYLAVGDLQGAERMAWRALALDPARLSARLVLARALAGAGRHGNAAFQYQRILRVQADHAEARRELEELIRRHARRRAPGDG